MEAVGKGPHGLQVTGAESIPAFVLPEGIIFKRGDLAASVRFRLARDVEYDHSGKYLAFASFDYSEG